jgi:hypothetical protein
MTNNADGHFLYRTGWNKPVTISRELQNRFDESFTDTYLMTPDVMARAWRGLTKNKPFEEQMSGKRFAARTFTLNFSTPTGAHTADRNLANHAQRTYDHHDVLVGELAFTMARNGDGGFVLVGSGGTEMWERVFSIARMNGEEYSAVAWADLAVLSGAFWFDDFVQQVAGLGFGFDDVTAYVNHGVTNFHTILDALQQGIDAHLMAELVVGVDNS